MTGFPQGVICVLCHLMPHSPKHSARAIVCRLLKKLDYHLYSGLKFTIITIIYRAYRTGKIDFTNLYPNVPQCSRSSKLYRKRLQFYRISNAGADAILNASTTYIWSVTHRPTSKTNHTNFVT